MLNCSRIAPLCLLLAFGATSACSKEAAASGTRGTRLSLTQPSNQTVTQGESNKILISVDRTGFAGPVSIALTNLPRGITAEGDTIPSGETSRNVVLVAAPTAEVVDNRIVTVTVKGADISLTQTFELTVKARN